VLRIPLWATCRGALDGDASTPHSPSRVSPNGLRLSGDGGEADGVRCSRGLGDPFKALTVDVEAEKREP
jgi:hypothetical protein